MILDAFYLSVRSSKKYALFFQFQEKTMSN